jgi:RNA-directed DNA polymerase
MLYCFYGHTRVIRYKPVFCPVAPQTRNFRALQNVYRAVERYWHKMLCSRSWKGAIRWTVFQRIKTQFPLLRPKLYLPYRELQAIALL